MDRLEWQELSAALLSENDWQIAVVGPGIDRFSAADAVTWARYPRRGRRDIEPVAGDSPPR
jgi:hypothetical protein